MREPDERAACCVVSALEGQGVPWALQHILICRVADEIRSVIADERKAVAAALEIEEVNEEALLKMRDLASKMRAQDATKKQTAQQRRTSKAKAS